MHKSKEFKLIKTAIVYDNFLKVRQDIVLAPNGVEVDYNYIDSNTDAVIILPIYKEKIVYLKQYRYPLKKYLYDLPAGKVENGQSNEEAAAMELKEETGYTAEKFEYLSSFYHMPGKSNSKVHAYIATNLSAGEKRLEKTEFADVFLATQQEFEEILISKEVEAAMAAAYWAAKLKKFI